MKYLSQREIIRDCQSSWHGPVRWEAGVDQSAFEHNKHDDFAFFVSCNQLLQHEYYVFSTSCNKTAYHWCYIIHRITIKLVGFKWFDTLTFTFVVDYRVTARKWTSADLMLGQRRGQVRWKGDIDQSALEHACQSNLSVSCPYWQWFMTDHISIKIYLCNTIKSNILTEFINYLTKWLVHREHNTLQYKRERCSTLHNVSCEEGAINKRSACHHLWLPILLRDLKITIFSVEPAKLNFI